MKSEATRLLSEKGKVRRGDNEQNCADGSKAGKERFSRPRTVEHPGAAADRAQPLAFRPLQQNNTDDEECQHKMEHENSCTHAPPPTCTCRNLNTCHGTTTTASCQPCAFDLSDAHTRGLFDQHPAWPHERKCYQSDARSDGDEDIGTQ